MAMRRISDHRRQFMELYDQGLSDRKIGEALGFSRTTVGDFRRRLGLPAHFKFSRPSLTDEEKLRIRELHSEGLPINKIAEKISRSPPTVFDFCRDEGLDTSMSRGKGYRRRLNGQRLVAHLKEQGPTPQSVLSEELGIEMSHFPRLSRELFEQVERFKFHVGSGGASTGGTKYGGTQIYGKLGDMGPVFAIRDDPRIIDFVADHTPFKVETAGDARTLVQHLKKKIGYERARAVVERLGYQYQTPSHKAERRGRPRPTGSTPEPRKFTDEQFLMLYKEDLNDTEIAAELGVSQPVISYRRRKLGLPPQGRGRFRALDLLPQIEDLTIKSGVGEED
jgi:transposase